MYVPVIIECPVIMIQGGIMQPIIYMNYITAWEKKKKKPILCTVLSVTMTAHTIAAWLQFFNCSGCLNLSINISSFPDEIAEYPNEEFSSHS